MGDGSRRASGPLSVLFLSTMFLGYAVYAIDRTVLSAMIVPMSSSLRLDNTQLGFLVAAQYIGVLAVVYFAGILSDKYGRLKIIVAGLAVFTAFTWLIGLSNNFAEAFIFRFASGVGEGVFWPVAMASVASYFGARKGFALGVFYVGFDAGSATGPALAGLVFSLTSEWQYTFLVAPLIGLVPIAMALLQRNSVGAIEGAVDRLSIGRDALRLIRQRNVALVMSFAFVATWASVWQVTFLPLYFNKVLGYGIVYAAYLTSIVPISGAVGKLALGRLSDTHDRRRMLVLISGLVVLAYLAFFGSTGIYFVILAAVVMSFFSSAVFPIMQALMADSCGGRIGTALGLNTTSQSVATVLSPLIAASLFRFGVGKALAVGAMIPAVLMIVVALLLKEPRMEASVETRKEEAAATGLKAG